MNRPIVTTGQHPDGRSEELARQAAGEVGSEFVPRKKRSVRKLMNDYGRPVLVAGKDRFEYHTDPDVQPLFFHPGLAAIRIKRLRDGGRDVMADACGLRPGDSFLDCTLGLGTDSTVASFIAGPEGRVTGCEADPIVAYIVSRGLGTYTDSPPDVLEAMRRIRVCREESGEYLGRCPDNSHDIVYLDPMFEEAITESAAFAPLRSAGVHGLPGDELFREARRVARRRVVLKAHFKSGLFDRYGFSRIERPNTKFHYGVLDV
ncbi:class I SAM-dependent methyltransferase [Edaphobacillus lindanitolerans]|uniref:Putative SAM-dependent methyltransferase n=1 Tax=Edaphobacillus lindanitolerans TaxID=550447 RepID=A0A1U7PP04_9BACI|nr:class I SAM-dependent methyltransferase [Edaphobacillus lindanitolerans]SIT80499.1 Putative SAM-dependent methyltransferase [Edaphobacillus lindanitolerans]